MKKFTISLLCLVTALVTGSIGAEVAPMVITSVSSTPTLCTDVPPAGSGMITVSLMGGLSPYMVTLTSTNVPPVIAPITMTGTSSVTFSNLPVGSYEIAAVDSTTPIAFTDDASINVPSFAPINIELASFVHPTFFGANNGSIMITAEGGPSPCSPSYDYYLGMTLVASAVGSPFTFSGLSQMTYNVTVVPTGVPLATAACVATADITLISPSALTIMQTGATPPTCNGGSDGTLTVTVGGGVAPYLVTVNPGALTATGNGPDFTFTGLQANTYTATVTDSVGSPAAANSAIVFPPQTALTITSVTATPATCPTSSNGTLTINVNNETSATLNYSIISGPVTRGPQASNVFTGLPVGNYTVQVATVPVTIPPLCAVAPAVITSPSAVVVSLKITNQDIVNDILGSIVATVTGGTPPYIVTLTPGGLPPIVGTPTQTVFTFNNLVAGAYSVTAVDVNGCTMSDPGIVLCIRGQSTNPITNFITAVLCQGGCATPA